MKRCKDCAYFGSRITPDPRPPVCKNEAAYLSTDPVFGYTHYRSCEQMRETICGKEAKFWAKRNA